MRKDYFDTPAGKKQVHDYLQAVQQDSYIRPSKRARRRRIAREAFLLTLCTIAFAILTFAITNIF